jgi:integrase
MTTHELFDGRLQIYRRGGRNWQCAARVGGRRFRSTTGEESLARAKEIAEDWYLDLRGKLRSGEIVAVEKTFGEAAELYLREARVLAATVRSPVYVKDLEHRVRKHLIPFFGKRGLSEVNRGLVQAYRVQRAEETIQRTSTPDKSGKPPARSTMTQELVHLRGVLKTAEGLGWIPHVPNLSMPYMTQGKRERRAWFAPEEYKQLYEATRRRITTGRRRGWRKHYEELHDRVLFMANTGLRPDEAERLEIRDVAIERDPFLGEDILVIDVRGKTGTGYCKSMPGAVHPFRRLVARRTEELARKTRKQVPRPLAPTDRVFAPYNRDLFNTVLREEGLKFDRDGRPRTQYSLRHTYISMRLMEGANIHQVANNCRTSVQMIEEFYAAHIKDRIDTRLINVQRPKPAKRGASKKDGATPGVQKVVEGEGGLA